MTTVVVAYDGGFDLSAVAAWLKAERQAELVAVTVDVGQSRDVEEARARALSSGAARAHVLDAIEVFARECALPAIRRAAADGAGPVDAALLATPLVARQLAAVLRLEAASALAVVAGQEALASFVASLEPGVEILAVPAMVAARAVSTRQVSPAVNLLQRPIAAAPRVADMPASIALQFEDGLPVSLNGVPLSLVELFESVSLIAGQHGIGVAEGSDAPAAVVLQAAYASAPADSGVVTMAMYEGRLRVDAVDTVSQVVMHA